MTFSPQSNVDLGNKIGQTFGLGQFLDRHLGWRSQDPTLDIWSNFVKKKKRKAFYQRRSHKDDSFSKSHPILHKK